MPRERRNPLERDAEGRKQCRHCDEWLDVSQFPPHSSRPDGLYSYCKGCQSITVRKDKLWRLYKLTPEMVVELLHSQGNACSICENHLTVQNLHVDHDHSCCLLTKGSGSGCGRCVRGLLCPSCNLGLGSFGDDPETLSRAAKYLRRKRNAS